MKFLLLSCTITFLTWPCDAVRGQAVLGARPIALGQAAVALPESDWSVFSNPSMIDSQARSLSLFGVRYYGLTEITDIAATLVWSSGAGTFGLGAHRYGYELFSEKRMRVIYKNRVGHFHYGVALNYTHISLGGGYGSAGALGVDLGISAFLPDRFRMGARVTNVNRPKIGSSGEELPGELGIGFSYRVTDWALFLFEAVKDVRFPVSCRSGMEIFIFEGFAGRLGVTTEPMTFSGGFGYRSGFGEINIAAQNHIDLGISPGLDISVNL